MPRERTLPGIPCEPTAMAWFLCLALLLFPGTLSAAPNLVFKPQLNKVKVHGVPVGGDVVFLSDSHEVRDWTRRVISRLEFRQGNSKGIAVLNNVSVVDPSIWAAVDLTNGGFDVDSPSGQYQPVAVNPLELFAGGMINYDGDRLDLVVVRDGKVWHVKVNDGGGNDRSPSPDARVEIDFVSFAKVFPSATGTSQDVYDGPLAGDLLIGIDADRMTYFTVVVDGIGSGK